MSILALILKLFSGKKASKGFVLFIFFAYLIFDKGPVWYQVLKKEKSPPPVLGEKEVPKNIEKDEDKNDNSCLSYLPFENYDINIKKEKITKKGDYYEPTGSGKAWEGMLWLEHLIQPNFKKIYIEYEIKSDENYEKPPAFIWGIARIGSGNTRQVFAKSWIPEYTESDGEKIPQLVGFARKLDYESDDLKRDSSLELPDSVKPGQLDSLTIERTDISGNEMMATFIYKYISSRTGTVSPFTFSKKMTFPFSDVENSGEKLDIGIGTFIGHSIRIISFLVCY